MSIQYTYEIVNVDQAARSMEVVYSSEGLQTMHIGARLPFEGESLEAVIQMYAPVAYWREQEAVVVAPEQGTSGTITETDPEPPSPTELRIAELKQLLLDSDYKVLPDYDKPSEDIKAARQAWRDEIRALEQQS
jgi:hypothetical protein